MHIVAIICKKLDSIVPFFVDTPEGQIHNESLQAWKTANQDLFVSHEVYRDEAVYISRWTYNSVEQALNFGQKMEQDLPEMIAYRDNYILQNGQELWNKIIKEDESVMIRRKVPVFIPNS